MVYSRNQKKANMTPTQGSWQEPVGHAKDFVFILKAVGAAEGVCVCVCVCVCVTPKIHTHSPQIPASTLSQTSDCLLMKSLG